MMATTTFNCDVEQGFNLQNDAQCLIGHLTELEIGDGEKFKIDLGVTNPNKIGGDEETKDKVVGVISSIYWEGGHADPIYIGCRISTDNKKISIILLHTNLSNTQVKCGFIIYDYDPKSKTYYPCFHSENSLDGLIAKNNDELEFSVDSEAASDVASPKNYNFYIAVMPSEVEQSINYAVDEGTKFSKKWGVTVAE
jgi:hypothetical protein